MNRHPLAQYIKDWAISLDPKNGNKRPVTANATGQLMPASINRDGDWMTYDQAVELSRKHPGSCVGARLTRGSGVVVIDVDKNHPVSPERTARWIGSYSERSSSGLGTHTFVLADMKGGHRSAELSVEVYADSRYIICTGDTIVDRPIERRDDKVKQLLDRIGVSANTQSTAGGVYERATVTEDVVNRARDVVRRVWSNQDVRRLWKGDWLALGFPSQSEADASLIERLAFVSDDNEAVCEAFRRSGLGQRAKAQTTYVERTLDYIRRAREDRPAVDHIDISALTQRQTEAVKKEEQSAAQSRDQLISSLLERIESLTAQVADLTAKLAVAQAPASAPVVEAESSNVVAAPTVADMADKDGVIDDPRLSDWAREQLRVAEHIDYDLESAEDDIPAGAFADAAIDIAKSCGFDVPQDFAVAALASCVSGLSARTVGNMSPYYGTGVYTVLVAPPGTGKSISSTMVGLFGERTEAAVMASTVGGRASVAKLRANVPAGVLHWSEIGTDIARMVDDQSGSVGLRQVIQMFDRSRTSPAESALVVGGSTIPRHHYMTIVGDTQPTYLSMLLSRDASGSGVLSRLTTVIHGKRDRMIRASGESINESTRKWIDMIASMQDRAAGGVPAYVIPEVDPRARDIFERDAAHWGHVRGAYRSHGQHTAADYCARMTARAERLAIAIAVGNSPYNPVITEAIAAYAVRFVNRHYLRVADKLRAADRSASELAVESIMDQLGQFSRGEITNLSLDNNDVSAGNIVSGQAIHAIAERDRDLADILTIVGRGDMIKGLSSVIKYLVNDAHMLRRVKVGGSNPVNAYIITGA